MNQPATAVIGNKLKERISNNLLEVPMLPEVAGRAVRLAQDPDSEAADLAKLIQSDQTLAGRVMKVANSAAYSPNSSIVSLQQAITRLGMKLIAEIALSASINARLFNTPGYEAHVMFRIRYSLASGLWAKEVARACRKNVEAAFLSGLLHDIGRPVALQAIIEIAKEHKIGLEKADVYALEDNFENAIGVRVLETWEMPKTVCETLRYFHNYKTDHSAQLQTMIVIAGSLIAGHFLCEEDEETQCMTLEELKAQSVFADLNLYPDQIDELMEKESAVNDALEAFSS